MRNIRKHTTGQLMRWSMVWCAVMTLVSCVAPTPAVRTVEASSPASLAAAPTLTHTAYFPILTRSNEEPLPTETPVPTDVPTPTETPVPTETATITPTSSPTPPPATDYNNIIFLHHSVGANLIFQGGVYQKFHALGYEFWDHDYNYNGMRRQTNTSPFYTPTGFIYNIPGDNTDIIPGLHDLFSQPLATSGVPALPGPCNITGMSDDEKAFTCLMRHDVIIIKSCYPNADIYTDAQLENYKTVYRMIANRAAQYPNKIFITLGFPPKNRNDYTNADAAANARAFMNWLKTSPDITGPTHPNFFVYDIFDQLAGTDNFLRPEYATGYDSHPNQQANVAIAPGFVNFVDTTIKAYIAAGH